MLTEFADTATDYRLGELRPLPTMSRNFRNALNHSQLRNLGKSTFNVLQSCAGSTSIPLMGILSTHSGLIGRLLYS